jgi:hypothetical protein
MPPNDTMLRGYDPASTDTSGTRTFYGNFIYCSTWNSSATSCDPTEHGNVYNIDRLRRVFGKLLNEAEKNALRLANVKPTAKGVIICQAGHSSALRRIRTLPNLQARFDRRIPCWRAGRWHSLT